MYAKIAIFVIALGIATAAQAQEQHPWRAAIEELGFLGISEAHYVKDHDLNSRDWDFRYSIHDVPRKFSGAGLGLDTNGFGTNFVMHPIAGTVYYQLARGNRLSWEASFAYSFVSSLVWEYLAEWREQASINDIVVTPISGMVLGENLHQLGAFFDRGCGAHSRVLGAALAPSETVHRWLDGIPLAEQSCDRDGFPRLGWHQFRVDALWGSRQEGDSSSREARLSLSTDLISLDQYGQEGKGTEEWDNSEVASMRGSISWVRGRTQDMDFHGEVLPWGLHARDIHLEGGELYGDELLFGFLVGMEASSHTWDGLHGHDSYFALNVPGAALRYRIYVGGLTIEPSLEASVAWVGQDSLALDAYLHKGGDPHLLTTVMQGEHYNFGGGFRVQPGLRLMTRWLDLGGMLEATSITGIRALDRDHSFESPVGVQEARYLAEAWLRAGPERWPARVTLMFGYLRHTSGLGGATATRQERNLLLGLSGVF